MKHSSLGNINQSSNVGFFRFVEGLNLGRVGSTFFGYDSIARYVKFNLTVLYTKTSIGTSEDRSHRHTVTHTDIKFKKITKKGF